MILAHHRLQAPRPQPVGERPRRPRRRKPRRFEEIAHGERIAEPGGQHDGRSRGGPRWSPAPGGRWPRRGSGGCRRRCPLPGHGPIRALYAKRAFTRRPTGGRSDQVLRAQGRFDAPDQPLPRARRRPPEHDGARSFGIVNEFRCDLGEEDVAASKVEPRGRTDRSGPVDDSRTLRRHDHIAGVKVSMAQPVPRRQAIDQGAVTPAAPPARQAPDRPRRAVDRGCRPWRHAPTLSRDAAHRQRGVQVCADRRISSPFGNARSSPKPR